MQIITILSMAFKEGELSKYENRRRKWTISLLNEYLLHMCGDIFPCFRLNEYSFVLLKLVFHI